jgi:peroxiredoxin Q/BCP
VADHERFKEKYNLEVTLAADENRQAIDLYGVWVEKNRDGRTFMGIERATYLIDADGRIARIWREVAAPGHAVEVLEAARGL